ncbi:MAG TPA: dTDP-4-dehydrorhamnose reductase, partial [Gemmatimonadales bacterium]|nr:dTDP-4-dehydrorhamnose reductase [Gemmatimonadales bacterium]
MAPEFASGPILVLGATGQVGRELPRALASLGPVVALDRKGADLSQPESLPAIIDAHRPSAIVNAAAYTAVDRAETEAELAMTVNGVAPGVLARAAAERGISLVHYSTDYVFDGSKSGWYVETDPTGPVSSYGRSKLQGEAEIRLAGGRHLILRTCWVFAAEGTNFLRTMLRVGRERELLRVVNDQVGAPTPAALIAEITARLLGAMRGAGTDDARWGTYHLAAAGETSWHGYARYLIGKGHELGFTLRVTPEAVEAISTAEYPTPARRPANSRLDCGKLRTTFGVTL